MKGRTIAVAVVAAAIIIVAALMVIDRPDDEGATYRIDYVLDGGEQNPLNPTEYRSGESVRLYDAYKEGKVFVSWYLDEELTRPCSTIKSYMEGDLTLYADWRDDPIGKMLTYSVEGFLVSGPFESYHSYGDMTVSYISQREDGDFMLDCDNHLFYYDSQVGDLSVPNREIETHNSYWVNTDFTLWTYVGVEILDTYNGQKLCSEYFTKQSDGSTLTVWVADGWIVYKAERVAYQTLSSSSSTYTLTDVGNVEGYGEIDVLVYEDLGINVIGDGSYEPGQTITLTVETEEGTTFGGWYDSNGRYLSSKETINLMVEFGEVRLYAMNTSDPDIETVTGVPFDQIQCTDDTEWIVNFSDGGRVVSFTGDPAQFSFGEPGEYTVYATDDAADIHRIFTVRVNGVITMDYVWSFEDRVYYYDLDILYSDLLHYRELYGVDQRFQDTEGGHVRDRTFVTYEDPYVQELASVFMSMTSGMSSLQRANFILEFCQSMEYQDDYVYTGYEEYWKFPLETLYDAGGDCEDTAILMVAIAKAMGYDSAILILPGHMAAAIAVDGCEGYRYVVGGESFYYAETTATEYVIGQMPDSMIGSRATIVVI